MCRKLKVEGGSSSSKEPGPARACVPGHLQGLERVGGSVVGLAGLG